MKLLFCFVCLFLQVVDVESMKHILRYNGMTQSLSILYQSFYTREHSFLLSTLVMRGNGQDLPESR